MAKMAIGIDLGGTNLRAACVSEEGKVLALEKCKTPVSEGPRATVEAMAGLIQKLEENGAFASREDLRGVGIGSPGPLSREKRMIFQTANLPGFDRFPIGETLEELTGLKVKIDNDAKCATYGEALFGVAKDYKNFVLMTYGTGIGGGIFVDGKMVYGKTDGACEIGHMTLYPHGRACQCTNHGCLEQYISASAFKRRAKEKSGLDLGGKEILEKYDAGEAWAKELVEEFTEDMAIGIASLVSVFNPELVVLAGGLFTSGGGPLLEKARAKIAGKTYASLVEDMELKVSALSGDAGVLGAASLLWHE